MNRKPAYFDYQATTPVNPRVLEAMLPYFTDEFANPHANSYAAGIRASRAIEAARSELAKAIGCRSSELVFTSGATEANNIAMLGVASCPDRNRIGAVSQATEHSSVLEPLALLDRQGIACQIVPVDRTGLVNEKALAKALEGPFKLASIQLVNNETGVIQPIARISEICRDSGVLLHCDCAQAIGRISVNLKELGVDLASFSAHKMYGPKGIGALFITERARKKITPLFAGGGQEHGIRPGTLPVHQCVGMARAATISTAGLESFAKTGNEYIEAIRARFKKRGIRTIYNGIEESVAPGCVSVTLPDYQSDGLLALWHDLAISTGSACDSSRSRTSHVLRAMKITREMASSTIRISIGHCTSKADLTVLLRAIDRLQG